MVFRKSTKEVEEQTMKNVKVRPAVTDDVFLERDKRQRERENRQALYTTVFLGVISIFLFGLSISLLVIGVRNNLEDLLILGSIFLVAGVGFIILLFVLVCKHMTNSISRWINRVSPENEDEKDKSDVVITKEDIEKQRKPTAIQLYGEDKIIHVPNPKELSDPEIPHPPMVCYPNTTDDQSVPVIQLPLKDTTVSESHETSVA